MSADPQPAPESGEAQPSAGAPAGPEDDPAELAADLAAPAKGKLLRLVVMIAVLAGLVIVGRATGITDNFSVEALRHAAECAGPWGWALIVLAFTIGLLLQVPGLVFAAAAILCYGPYVGGLLAYLGAVTSCSLVFALVRLAGGDLLSGFGDRPWVARALSQLETHPVRTVTLLRLVFWSSPQLNYAFALSGVRFLHHLVGTLIGLIPIKIAVVVFFDRLLVYLGVSA